MANFATQHSAIEDDAKIPAELADGTKGHFTPLQLSTGSTIPGLARGNRTFIKALDTTSITTAYLTEAGREGWWLWKAGNYASFITADTREGMYLKADAIASSAGAWVRVHDGVTIRAAWFGLGSSEAVDSSPAIQAAQAAATTWFLPAYGVVELPAGRFLVNTSIPIANYTHIRGAGRQATILIPGMTDGTGVFAATGTASRVQIEGLHVFGTWTSGFPAWRAGTGTAKNCIGIDLSGGGGAKVTKVTMRDVWVQGCTTGIHLDGWISHLDGVYIAYCELGFKGDNLNAVDLGGLMTEWNRKPFEITNSYGLTIGHLLSEDDIANMVAATIDSSKVINIATSYYERTNATYVHTEPHLIVGGTTECIDLEMHVTAVGAAYQDVPLIKLDRVRSGRVRGYIGHGSNVGVETTTNTKGVDIYLERDSGWLQHDASLGIGPVVNYFPNPRFEVWLRGWSNVVPTNATISKETTLVRRGLNALKVAATVSTTFNNVTIQIPTAVVTALRGRTIRMGAWVYVPNIAEYQNNDGSGLMPGGAYPGPLLQSYNGSVAVNSSTKNNATARGQWNYVTAQVAVQADATIVSAIIYASQSSNAATGNEYLVIDEITLVDASVPIERQMRGDYTDSALLPSFYGGRVELYADATPTDTDQIYEVGDKIWKLTPAGSASPGWICTTGGAGGTAVWNAMANLAA